MIKKTSDLMLRMSEIQIGFAFVILQFISVGLLVQLWFFVTMYFSVSMLLCAVIFGIIEYFEKESEEDKNKRVPGD